MSLFNKKKKVKENKDEVKVKSHIEKHKELLISLVPVYGDHRAITLVCPNENSFEAAKEEFSNNIGKNYILETNNGAHNLKYFCSVTFEEKEVSEVVIDE